MSGKRWIPAITLAALAVVTLLVTIVWAIGYVLLTGHDPYTYSPAYAGINRTAVSGAALVILALAAFAITAFLGRDRR